jgi:hypothetical protein
MNATYTIGYPAAVELERVGAWAREVGNELGTAAKAGLILVGGPLLGLAFVIALPIGGLTMIAWMAAKLMARKAPAVAKVAKRVALFAVGPIVGLAYVIAFPFVGLGALAYYGVRAVRN